MGIVEEPQVGDRCCNPECPGKYYYKHNIYPCPGKYYYKHNIYPSLPNLACTHCYAVPAYFVGADDDGGGFAPRKLPDWFIQQQ
eukprot:g80641.t1